MDSCVLLHRLQMFEAGCREQSLYTAVDSADEDRYELMTAHESHRSGGDGLCFY